MMRGRVASAPLRQMGLEHELLARSEADYVERAVALAGDDDRVRELRHIIRERAPTLLDTIEAPRALGALPLDCRPPTPHPPGYGGTLALKSAVEGKSGDVTVKLGGGLDL